MVNRKVHRKLELTSLYDDLEREGREPRARCDPLAFLRTWLPPVHADLTRAELERRPQLPRLQRAVSVARDSRITVTLIWPG